MGGVGEVSRLPNYYIGKGEFSNGTLNFIPALEAETCIGCGTCADSCHIRAITMHDEGNETEVPVVNKEICIGCGVCASACPSDALTMNRRPVLHVPPENTKEKLIRTAMEKGRI